ncbi:hypothetical protein [Cupriavidus pauculus]|uniref:hypothetical protein n=1 Tax=Cupriavidus pauculus TaxID=82633 RepID=UPI001247DDC8|nr:hypothetical protein [Cupriavidus pauculus]KAB0603732.1 hypothetical protein F7R19_06295 [Cupriavidus pauculus]UAL03447.1 hypothetical protein K8O84_22765 [Cupriavidus pauculus]
MTKRPLRLSLFLAGVATLAASTAAMARVDVDVNLGVPVAPVVVAPAPVYVAPRPVYVAPPPPPPVVYRAASPVYVAPPAVIVGWHGDRYWDGRRWYDRREYHAWHHHDDYYRR